MTRCPVYDCGNEVNSDGFVCPDCHLLMKSEDLKFLTRIRTAIRRRQDNADTGSLKERYQGYLNAAVHRIETVRAMR